MTSSLELGYYSTNAQELNTRIDNLVIVSSSPLVDDLVLRNASNSSSTTSSTSVDAQSGRLANPFLFANSILPVGIVTDRAGNVFVSSEDASVGEDGIPRSFGGSIITKYAPNGTSLGKIQVGPLFSPVDVVAGNRFALETNSGLILSLSPSGQINLIEPNQGIVAPWVNLKGIPIQTDQVYDVATGETRDFTGAIQPSLSSYGDIAVFNGRDFLDVYVSGISAGQAFPFILRLRLSQTLGNSAQVIMSSIATASPNEGSPPGIAVNSQGTVLTTLGVNRTTAGNFSAPVAFSVDFNPQNVTNSNRPLVFSNVDLSSRGMTTDAAGNFYIATGTIGTTLGGANGSGAIISLSPNLELTGIYTQGVVAAAQDVAVSPNGQVLYATIGTDLFGSNGVIGFQLPQVTATALPGNDLLSGDAGNDVLEGDARADVLTGGVGSDRFRLESRSDSLLSGFDQITDLAIGIDIINGPTSSSAANLAKLGSVSALTQSDIAAVLTSSSFRADRAATFSFVERTFPAINNGTSGFQSASDAIIEITGFTEV